MNSNLLWLIAGNVIRGACQWAMVVTLAKAGTPAMVGQYALGLAITAPIMLLAGLQLTTIQVTDAREDYQLRDYLGLRVLTMLIATAGVTAIVIGTGFSEATAAVIILVACSKAFDAVTDVYLAWWQKREEMQLVSQTWMLNAVSSLMFLIIGIFLTGSVIWAVAGSLAGSLLAFVWVLSLVRRLTTRSGCSICPNFDPHILGGLTRIALPMGGVGAVMSLNANVPRYFVQHYLGGASLGLFAAVAYPMVASDTLVNSLVQLTSPRLAKYYGANDIRSFKRLLLRLMTVGGLTGVVAVGTVLFVGHAVLLLLYRPEYASQTMVFVYVVIAVALGYCYMFIGVAVTAMRQFRIQFYVKVGVCVCLTMLSASLIPRFGLTGAAAALICTALVEGVAWGVVGYGYIWRQPVDPAATESRRVRTVVQGAR